MNVTFASSKGGVGKSTTCACVAAYLASRGDAVIAFDLDKNRPLGKWAERIDLPKLTVQTLKEDELRSAYTQAAQSGIYDHILIDLAGEDARVNLKAISVAHLVVIPANTSRLDVDEAAKLVDYVSDINEARDAQIPFRILYTKMRPLGPTNADREILAAVEGQGMTRMTAEITQRDIYKKMFDDGTLPHIKDPDKAGAEIGRVVDEIDAIITQTWTATAAERRAG